MKYKLLGCHTRPFKSWSSYIFLALLFTSHPSSYSSLLHYRNLLAVLYCVLLLSISSSLIVLGSFAARNLASFPILHLFIGYLSFKLRFNSKKGFDGPHNPCNFFCWCLMSFKTIEK